MDKVVASPPSSAERLGYIRRVLEMIWAAAGRWTLAWGALLVVQGLIPAAVVLTTKWLVDSIAAAVGTGATWETAGVVLAPAAIMGSLLVAQRALGGLNEWVSTAQSELVSDYLKELIHRKAAAADYGYYESAQYHDQLEQVNSQAGRTLQVLGNVGGLVQAAITFTSIAVILIQYSLLLPLVLVVSTLPAFFVILHHNKRYHAWWKQATQRRREAQYFDLMLTMDYAAAEVRINNLSGHFRTQYRGLRKALREERLSLLQRQVVAKLAASAIALLVTAATMAWIVLRAFQGNATLGDLALFYQAFNQGQSLVGALLQNAGQIFTHTLFLEHLFDFLRQESGLADPKHPAPFPKTFSEGVEFENVTFTYPGSERPALQQFNLRIPAGKIVAIVGENGAGKSTFIKLLCRFYDPNAGRVLIDGKDLRTFAQADLRQHISVMFQFPMKYQMSVERNITLSDIDGETDSEAVVRSAKAAGAHGFIARLPREYNTLLGRWFAEGTELSGGEWQRIALSRAFLRDAPLVILDEPTSSMDSWAENEWLERFRRVVEQQTALIITHRFSTAMQADIIHVMDSGNIIESGSHSELIARGGHYAASWHTQMQRADVRMVEGANVEA